jgi:hypothetical protein
VILHETLHYWQQLGSGFLVRLADEEWGRLLTFENNNNNKDITAPGPIRQMFVKRERFGFSAKDLSECLARYWDVHVINPAQLLEIELKDPKRSFSDDFRRSYNQALKKRELYDSKKGYSSKAYDLAMLGAAGNYATPYKILIKNIGSLSSAVLFPLLCHFAFQTFSPAYFFGLFAENIDMKNVESEEFQPNIDSVWNYQYPHIMKQCIEIYEKFGKFVEFGPVVFLKIPGLANHPVYKWVFDWIASYAVLLTGSPLANSMSQSFANMEPNVLAWFALERAFALPGIPLNRSLLLEMLSPPCITFADGKTWTLSRFYRDELLSALDESNRIRIQDREKSFASDESISQECLNIHCRWQKFIKAYRGY